MNVYSDPKRLDVHSALDALPAFPLDQPAIDTERRAKSLEVVQEAGNRAGATGREKGVRASIGFGIMWSSDR